MKRILAAYLGRIDASSREPDAADRVLARHLAWRLRALTLVLALTGLTAALDVAARPAGGPRPTPSVELRLGPESAPAAQSAFGDAADLAWRLSFYAMPASALLAAGCWARPRASRSILAAGWAASFLVPVAIALLPWSWWDAAAPEARPAGPFERIQERAAWGFYYFVVLSPAVLSLVPGVMRACLRVKRLLPAAVLPGWLLMAAAPFNGLLALAGFVSLAQVAPSPLLLAGMLLWLAAPLTYLARARAFIRPVVTDAQLREARRVRAIARSLALGSATCLLAYAATWEAFGFRLVGLDAGTSLLRPWEVFRCLLDFWARAQFVTVLGADLLLRTTLSAWRHQRDFASGPAAAEFDRLMARLEAATTPTGPT
ncbi:hypothetical protein [Paludisphaera soli]|uniref:hypothetical protein n=1 Tax=Paludisphaera soli TaxID=2712865 RepID=UPI0013ED963B|nr:hypothetical protein [Paludisphaera soli]